MRILVTAGNTQTPIDRVRCITNVFSGRTGTAIALKAAERGHVVTLLTSHPDLAYGASLDVRPYRTYAELRDLMAKAIPGGGFAAVIHAAAVSDYELGGVFVPGPLGMVDVSAGKVKGNHPELWLKLVPAPKLVDSIRDPWGFCGVLVKFKLEVGLDERALLEVAEASRRHSRADLMVANTLDGMGEWAYVGADKYRRVSRATLADALLDEIQGLLLRSGGN
ncbi:MAG: phosphopantothenoylcysteine decarboxylase [Gemmataceae bacterium]